MNRLPGLAQAIVWVSILFWPVLVLAAVDFLAGPTSPVFSVFLLICGCWAFLNWYRMHRVIVRATRTVPRRRRKARR